MRKVMALLMLTLICWSFISLAQTAVVSTSPVPAEVVAAATNPPVTTVWGFIKANWGQVCFALSWIIEIIFYFSPAIKANSLVEQIDSWLKAQSVPPTIS